LINRAKSEASHLILKYVARASVAVPFIIALCFALAAITVMLVERFGHVVAYWIMAAGLALIGAIAAIVVTVKEHEEDVAEQAAEKIGTDPLLSEATAPDPIALLGALLTAPGGATTILRVARLLGRNWPLVLLLLMMGALFWPTEEAERLDEHVQAHKPNGADDHMPSALRH
jgi:hypothetical protein